MQPWGVAGGGAKNEQSIQDLVAYLRTIQLKPSDIKATEAKNLLAARSTDIKTACPQYLTCPVVQQKQAEATLSTDTKALDTARTALQKAFDNSTDSDAKFNSTCTDLANQVENDAAKVKPLNVSVAKANACSTFVSALKVVTTDKQALAWTKRWVKLRRERE